MPSFNDFPLQPTTLAVLTNMNITEPTPIQAEAIPALLAGNDVVGQSPTGSGKTLAYGIPLVERISKERVVQALILVPTRELAVQISAMLSKLATSRRLSTALLVGGRPYGPQLSALRYGSQIVVGTPGRVKDHLDSGHLDLSRLRVCVLDEADQMLDSGFAPAIEEILTTTPSTRQMALFSATIPDWIESLKKKFLKNPVNIAITPVVGAQQSTIEQIAYQVPQEHKIAALCTLLHSTKGESSLIFGRTKYGVEKLGKQLNKLGFTVGTLHGNKSQRAREEVLTAFRHGQVQTLLATNVAARGLDITGIYQVINYELPESSDLFTHRIGRTGRMGRQGKAITLLVPSDIPKWRRMARNLGQAVSLQHLALDKEATATQPLTRPAASEMQEHEQNDEQWSDRKRFSPEQESNRHERPKRDSHPASYAKRQQKETGTSRTSVRQPEGFIVSERSYADKTRDSRRESGKRSDVGRTPGKYNARSFSAPEPQHQTGRRKPRMTSGAPTRRMSASNRSARREPFARTR